MSDSAAATIKIRGLGRRFGEIQALADLNLEAPDRAVTVLLGPNGAGKTTAIRMITGALESDAGSIEVFGMDPVEQGEAIRRRCGIVSAKPALYDRLSGYHNLLYAAELYDIPKNLQDQRIREAAGRFAIADALDQKVGGYSTGMKTRLALARSVQHEPDLLLLDEPTSGLDPESSQAVLALIGELTHSGKTVVLCTHLLLEAEGLADHVVVMEEGTDLVSGTPQGLARRFWPDAVVRIEVEDPQDTTQIWAVPGVLSVDESERSGDVTVDDFRRVPDLVAALVARGVRVTRVEPRVPSLEDLYFSIRRQRGATVQPAHPQPTPVHTPTEPVNGARANERTRA
ncbi:MAG: ABC transporter ATP-binding protein [Actinomycetia bacterium]|nr:ABC transporter ATP-binding protein [Actinomycetes bacterium]MCP4086763.1 ABC transporter ATP-binding protein [Actinomycetes bacterium]